MTPQPPGPAGPGPRGPDVPPAGLAPVETDRDPGLQPERTRLAWRRTTLSFAVTQVLALRQVVQRGGGALAAVAACLAAFAFLAFLWLAHRRIQRLAAPRPPVVSSRAAAAVAGCTVALVVCGAAVVW